MAPAGTSSLFHPKKRPLFTSRDYVAPPVTQQDVAAKPSGSRPRVPRKPKDADDADRPEGPYKEYKLVSSQLNGWRYDVMKFDSRKPVDIMTWAAPVKLNRKDVRRSAGNEADGPAAPVAVGPMLGPDGKPVVGMDGRVVMIDAEGKPIRAGEQHTNGGDGGKGKDKDKGAAVKKKFQKKTKQVFLVPDHIRQLRKEERYPWVIEDASGQEVWQASMEEIAKAETQAMFMPSADTVFKFVPANRWYKFQKKPHFHVPSLEEAENLMKQISKNKDPERWLLRRRNGQGPSEATAAMFKSEREGSAAPMGGLVHNAGHSMGPGGRKLKAVDSGGDLFGDDDEEGVDNQRRKAREYGQEGDLDEMDFEEDVQDDDEQAKPDPDDEEAKELEERLKREYKSANKTREGYIDESDDDEDMTELTSAGKDMRKIMKKLEKNNGYDDSDDEKNPYASSEEEPEEEPPQVPQGPAIIPPEPRPSSRSNSQAPGTPVPAGAKTPNPAAGGVKTESGSRATSPVPAAGHGGHSVVAMRATSPKMPKLKTSGNGSRAGSPLASTPTSPVARADSPKAKRKAEGEGDAGAPRAKKRRAQVALAAGGEVEDWVLIDWLRQTPNATTRDCIAYFTPFLKTEEKKASFAKLVKEVAHLKGGVLALRPSYRASAAPSPAPGSPTSPASPV